MSQSAPLPQAGVPGWRSLLRRWRSGDGALPTTLAGAEIALLIGFIGLRVTDVVQLAVSLPTGLQRSTAPAIDSGFALVYLFQSATIITALVRARRYVSRTWVTIDVATVVVVLLGQFLFTAPGERVGTWTAWGYSVSVCAALGAGIGLKRRRDILIAAVLLAGAYLVVSLPAADQHGEAGTAWSNAVAYFAFAFFTRALASFLRRLGREADAARNAAEAAGREAERDRQRRLLHDHETVMRLLADPHPDPLIAQLVRRQAAAGANRVRSFLSGPSQTEVTAKVRDLARLADIVQHVAADFADLPVDLAVDLVGDVVVDAAIAEALADALTTLLHNVRVHARATNVVIHADAVGPQWEVTVRDDGVGFDPSRTPLGFGLREQVIGNLDRHGVSSRVESVPGEGTAVTLTGTAADEAGVLGDARAREG